MKLLDILFGKKKANNVAQARSVTPQKHPDTCQPPRRPMESHVSAPGSSFENVSCQWTPCMDENDIVFFSVSTGNRPVFEANCDFAHLRIRNCLNGSRDGWMQSQYPQDYFEPREITLGNADRKRLRAFFRHCDFSEWKTPVHYAENYGAPGFHVDKSFRCGFSDGKQFACLNPSNTEFGELLSLIREIAKNNAPPEDRDFVERMLADTEKQYKHIYWLISQSLEEKWMELTAQGVPFFNYMVARELNRGDNANAEPMIHVIRFADGAAWVTESPVRESEYQWEPLPGARGNDLGAAYDLLTQHFETLPEPGRKLFPIVVIVLDRPAADDWQAAQARFRSLPGVERNVLTLVLVMGGKAEKRFLKKLNGVVYHINSMEDIIFEMDSPVLGF